jgi:hypothetical protein
MTSVIPRWLRILAVAVLTPPPKQPPLFDPFDPACRAARAELDAEHTRQVEQDARESEPIEWTPKPPRPDGLSDDQAAIAAVKRLGLPCNITATAEAEGLGSTRIASASFLLGHAPELAQRVENLELGLWYAALLCRMRERGHHDVAARLETQLPHLDPRAERDANYTLRIQGRLPAQ